MALGQTVTVVNRSGKIVSSSKHLVNVFKEAKSAYTDRKAEIKALRDADYSDKQAKLQSTKSPAVDGESPSRPSSRESRTSDRERRPRPKQQTKERPPVERGYSDSFTIDEQHHIPRKPVGHSGLNNVYDPSSATGIQGNELTRRYTDNGPASARSSSSSLDSNLAYGELPPPLPPRRQNDELELRTKMSKLQQLLDEANCVQHSVISTIESLQKNPERLAAVALTLGEISSLASKMAPGALLSMKSAFPVIVAILASPEFMIAAGVGVGVTVIALGGYKVIKKIKARNAAKAIENGTVDEEGKAEYDELKEIDAELSRIEMWRRGIAFEEGTNVGTSVEGEFVTPAAGRRMVEEGVLREDQLKGGERKKKEKEKKGKKSGKEEKEKEPNALVMMFKKKQMASA